MTVHISLSILFETIERVAQVTSRLDDGLTNNFLSSNPDT